MNTLDSITQIAYTLMIALNISQASDLGRKPVDNHQLFCMAQNIYMEARAEGEQGKQAVAHVVHAVLSGIQADRHQARSESSETAHGSGREQED